MVGNLKMALFAAYADAIDETTISEKATTTNSSDAWLTNSSFTIDVTPFQNSEPPTLHRKHFVATADVSGSESDPQLLLSTQERNLKKYKKKSKKSHKHKKRKICVQNVAEVEPGEYTIDKNRITEYKYAKTIARPCAPKYRIYKYIGLPRERRALKFKRYYQVILDKHIDGSASENEKLMSKDFSASSVKSEGANMTLLEEQEMSRQTASYNRELQVDPYDIETWIRYVNFQDCIFNFEKSFRKGSIAKGQRVTAERKLAILDRALEHNPDCEVLLRMRLDIAAGVFPADELQTQLKRLVERDSCNIVLWQGFIEATQCSMSHCTTSAVINLYIKCLHTLHTIRRTAKLNRVVLEESILRMLYQCGLFLRQAGLFEQLWTLLRMYLELNLSSQTGGDLAFGAMIAADEKQLVDLEDAVLTSQLPIHELWLRIEKLREASHWLPAAASECEDPQRLVFTEDVSELIHPIAMPGNTFRLTVTILTLLKIPLLPCRHSTMKVFSVDYVPWSLDSIETLLPIFYPLYQVAPVNSELLFNAQKLAVGPQYLKILPGQEEYLQFVLTVMASCSDCLTGRNKTAITVWWFRFLRLLTVLEQRDMFKVTAGFKKKLRAEMKVVLRENSANVVLFREYALVESEENFEAGLGVLTTAIRMSCGDGSVFEKTDEEQRAAIIATLRTFVELHLFRNKHIEHETQQVCLKYICALISGKFTLDNAPRFVTRATIDETKQKFAEVNELLLTKTVANVEDLQGVDHFLPDFTSDWLILNAYLLFLHDVGEARVFIENVLAKLNSEPLANQTDVNQSQYAINRATMSFRKELLYEFLVAILFKTCTDVPGTGMYPTLDKHIQLGIQKYPNNLFLLATLAKMQSFHSNYGQPWWKLQRLLLTSGHALSTLFAVLIANQRINDIESNWVDTVTGKVIVTDNTFKNRMLSLFKRITRSDMCTRRCGLVWRLYLQFLHAYFEPKVCRDAYYLAVEECPWLKSLYVDAAIYIPEDLAQIQDLVIEKQLRIHVTPEELDVLRS